jgi:hypothetical protein
MEKIVSELLTLLEDKPHIVLDDNTIWAYIEDNKDELIKEIRKKMREY